MDDYYYKKYRIYQLYSVEFVCNLTEADCIIDKLAENR
jgi:hypothetical protein